MVYVAEKKQETMSFFDPKLNTKDLDTLKNRNFGNEFLHQQHWGEQLTDVKQPVLCIVAVSNGTVSVLGNLPDGISPGQVCSDRK